MPGVSQVIFVASSLLPSEVEGKRVIDIGSKDYNGSVKPLISKWKPSEYLGVDLEAGPSVDVVVSADDLVSRFGKASFDIVLCIEMMEHTPNWKESIRNIKEILKPNGILLLTTRSLGYPCHGFPHDHWRFEVEDIKNIFGDFKIDKAEKDYAEPGIFFRGQKPENFKESDLSNISIYNINIGSRTSSSPLDRPSGSYYRRLRIKQILRDTSSKVFLGCGRIVSKILGIK